MQYRTLGKTGWKVSAVSMGCWGIGGQWGQIAEQTVADTIDAALGAGVNLFDTADAYGLGRSEILLGRALKGRREGVYIATKVGNWGRRYEDAALYKTTHSVVNCCHASLYRLGVDTIDLYQCHIQTPHTPEVFVEAFEQLRDEGKIRHYGISTNDLGALKAINANDGCAACQIRYSMLTREAETDILPWCRDHNIGVLLRGPLAEGRLTGKFSPETTFGPSDMVREKWNDGPQRDQFLVSLEKIETLRERLPKERQLLDVALQFTLANAAVTCPIPGMKTPDQARSNAAAAHGALSEEEIKTIDDIFPPPVRFSAHENE